MKKGQVFTPTDIVKYMISLIDNKNKKILEPSFWKWVFINHLKNKNIYWIEKDKILFDNFIQKNKNNKYINIDFFINDSFLKKFNSFKDIDCIIWNPPYIQNNDLDKITKKEIKDLKLKIDNKEWNLYYYFIYLSIKQLKNKGQLIFIVPITFLTNTYAKSLRDYMYDNWYFKKIISLEESKIFNDKKTNKADVEVIIFEYIKDNSENKNICKKENKKINIKIIKDKYQGNINNNKFEKYYIKHFTKDDFFWNIYIKNTKNKYNRPITDIFDIYVWIVSWYDKGFYISEEQYKLLPSNEKKYIKSFLKAKNHNKINNKNILSKYIFFERWEISNEKELSKKAPIIYSILLKNKETLLKRYWVKNLPFWEFATIRNLDLFKNNNEKFFIPCITRKENIWFSKYVWDAYGGWDIITLSFKKNISKIEKDFYTKVLLSDDYSKYIEDFVPKKWNRRLYTHKFLTTILLPTIK